MSVSHPYLKQLKVHVLRFCQHNGAIKDDHPLLLPFCRTLEDILRNGLSGDVRRHFWHWMIAFLSRYTTQQLSGALQLCIEYSKTSKKAITDCAKGRLTLRCALNRAVLVRLIRKLRDDKQLLYDFYDDLSILGDDILSELLLSLLAPLELKVKFALNIRMACFLDETWELPCFRQYEMVPCDRLGIELAAIDGRLVVLEVKAGSVADEDLKIEAGDILDDLFGESLRGASTRKVGSLMEDFKGSPVYVSVVKCILPNGRFFAPMLPYLEKASLCRQALLANRQRRVQELRELGECCQWEEESPMNQPISEKQCKNDVTSDGGGFHRVKFCGFLPIGRMGTVEQIENGVIAVLKKLEPKREVLIELGETEVTVMCAHDKSIILQHGFPEISSCGRRVDRPLNFSYIAGETTCTLAKSFFCYVFEATCDDQAKTVLKGIADGFDRTHWAV